MRIFHVPTRYLDNSTLYTEYGVLLALFKNLTKSDPISEDRLYWKFVDHKKYIFYRLLLVSEAMENRGLDTDIDILKMMDIASIDSIEYEVSIADIENDIQFLSELWEEHQGYDPALPDYLEKLALTNSEDLLQEVQFLIAQYEEEYGV